MWIGLHAPLAARLALQGETLGAALYGSPGDSPRQAARNGQTDRAISDREARFKRRPNRYKLCPVEDGQWPWPLEAKRRLFDAVIAAFPREDAASIIFFMARPHYWVPQRPGFMTYPIMENGLGQPRWLAVFDPAARQLQPIPLGKKPFAWGEALWLTRRGEPVMMGLENGRSGSVVCLTQEGGVRWRFVPPLALRGGLEYAHTSPQGVLTLYAKAAQGAVNLWRLDGEEGKVLVQERLDWPDRDYRMDYAGNLGCFVVHGSGVRLLDQDLREVRRWKAEELDGEFCCGRLLEDGRLWKENLDETKAWALDLCTGELSAIDLERRGQIDHVLPDGCLASDGPPACLYDQDGKVVFRYRPKQAMSAFFLEGEQVYLLEYRDLPYHSFLNRETLKHTQVHLWRLQREEEG